MSDPHPGLLIFIIGGRLGESIVIRTPGGRFGIVDCYASDWTNRSNNPTLSRLQALGASKLHFVALTHPHMDHLQGLPAIFEAYAGQVEFFWRPPWGPVDFVTAERRVFYAKATRAWRNEQGHGYQALTALLNRVDGEVKSDRLKLMTLQNDSDALYDGIMLQETEHDFSVMCLGPSTNVSTPYLAKTSAKAIAALKLDEIPKWRATHNEISSVLAIKYGKWIGILGGDTEQASWKDIIHRRRSLLNSVRFFKVSHHGSETGSFPELWDSIQSEKCEAVITCFARQGLPDVTGLQHLRHPRFSLHSTNSSLARQLYLSSQRDKDSSEPFPWDVEPDRRSGEVRVAVHANGSMTFDYSDPAGPLKL